MTADIGDCEIIAREDLEKTCETEYGPNYRCPRCGYDLVTEYCDCPDCGWAGMCQEGWDDAVPEDQTTLIPDGGREKGDTHSCLGCGQSLHEYSDGRDWCVSCAPELFEGVVPDA